MQYAVRSFADALDDIPMALAENAGLSPITELSAVKSRQIAEGITSLGIDCNQVREETGTPRAEAFLVSMATPLLRGATINISNQNPRWNQKPTDTSILSHLICS